MQVGHQSLGVCEVSDIYISTRVFEILCCGCSLKCEYGSDVISTWSKLDGSRVRTSIIFLCAEVSFYFDVL